MQISGLQASNSFSSSDVLAIEINGVTYKLTGATLAAAVASIGSYLVTGDIANNLTTTASGKVLDARQGKALNDAIGTKVNTSDIANNLTTTASGKVLDARQGKALNDAINNNTLTAPTAGTNVTIDDGGYTQIGKLVIVNLRFTTSSALNVTGYMLATGFPVPKTRNSTNMVPVNCSGFDSSGAYQNMFINFNGALQLNGSLAAGMHMASAVYVSN